MIHLTPIHIPTPSILKNYFNITLPSTSSTSAWSSFCRVSQQNFACNFFLTARVYCDYTELNIVTKIREEYDLRVLR